MRTLYLVSKRLPRVCMGGSQPHDYPIMITSSAPRVHGWFLAAVLRLFRSRVCPACAWVVPMDADPRPHPAGLPRVCMGGSKSHDHPGGFAFVLRHPTLTPFPL